MAALQTKTFTWGSYAYQSESNAYVLELTLTENSVDQVNNKSNVTYSLVLKSGSNNRFTGQIDSVIKLAGVQVASGSKQISAAYNSSWTLLTGTTNITHGTDGSLNMPIEVSINTYNSYAPPDKTLSWSWALTTIPRASSITSAANVDLDSACSVVWTPNSASFKYKLKFSLGSWTHTTGFISPNKTSAYTYNRYTIPLNGVAQKITGSKTGKMSVVLHTYSASDSLIGSSEAKEFTVTIPETVATKPTVTMTVDTVGAFDGLCLQGKSKLQGTLSASGKYGATIKSLTMKVDGKSYTAEDEYLSNVINISGKIPVVATAVDSRGFSGTFELNVTVQPYYRPRLTKATAYRCTSGEIPADNGEYLKIKATVDYASVDGKNSAALLYRYRTEGAKKYSQDIDLVKSIASGNSVETGALLGGNLLKESAWCVQIVAKDAVGEETVATIQIPCEAIFRHRPAGGKGVGYGGYCENDGLDVHWDARFRKDAVFDESINGMYVRHLHVNGGKEIRLQSQFQNWDANGTSRQCFLVFGSANALPVHGICVLHDSGSIKANTITNCSATCEETGGVLRLSLDVTAWDDFLILSTAPFTII